MLGLLRHQPWPNETDSGVLVTHTHSSEEAAAYPGVALGNTVNNWKLREASWLASRGSDAHWLLRENGMGLSEEARYSEIAAAVPVPRRRAVWLRGLIPRSWGARPMGRSAILDPPILPDVQAAQNLGS